jgi:hypothetical protein
MSEAEYLGSMIGTTTCSVHPRCVIFLVVPNDRTIPATRIHSHEVLVEAFHKVYPKGAQE